MGLERLEPPTRAIAASVAPSLATSLAQAAAGATGTRTALPAQAEFIHFSTDYPVYAEPTDADEDPAEDGCIYYAEQPYVLPACGMAYLHLKRATSDTAAVNITVYGN